MKASQPARWFRMYAEFLTDPKVQELSETDQRRYIMILCYRCANGPMKQDETQMKRQIAFQLRVSEADFAVSYTRFIDLGLIDRFCEPTHWKQRQYVSDLSTDRVRKFRMKRFKTVSRNVAETAPETENRVQRQRKERAQDQLFISSIGERQKPETAKPFHPPTKEQVCEYMLEIGVPVIRAAQEAEKFARHHEDRNWKISGGRGPKMKNWKSAVLTWKDNMARFSPERSNGNGNGAESFEERRRRESAEAIRRFGERTEEMVREMERRLPDA